MNKEIKEKKAEAKTVKEYIKWHALDLLNNKKLSVKRVSKITEVPGPTLYGWIRKYTKGGAKLLIGKKKGGRRHALMSLEEERKLLESLLPESKKGLIITAKLVQKKIEEKVKRSVCKDVAYRILRRHGWRKIVPRPSHPGKNSLKQEEFKKTFTSSWTRPRKNSNHLTRGN